MSDEVEVLDAPPIADPAEAEARLVGWRPQDEFDGPAEKWKPAAEFLEKGKQINGFMRKDLEKLRTELSKRDATLAELQQTIKDFASFHQETETRVYERARKELQAERAEAISAADGERVIETEDRIAELDAAHRAPAPAAKPAPKPDPIWEAWLSDNSWYRENRRARALCEGLAEEVREANPDLTGRGFLDEVKRLLTEEAPQFFKNARREAPAPVGASGERRPGGGGKKTYADLPAEARATCDKFVAQKLLTREQYVAEYDWS